MNGSLLRAASMGLTALLVSSCVDDGYDEYAPKPPPNLACASIPCGGSGEACEPFLIEPNVVMGSLTSDAESIVVRQYATPGSVRRLPKPGCSAPLLDVGGLRVEWAVVSHDFIAWTQRGNESTCLGSNLSWCDPRNCDPDVIPVLGEQPEFEKLAGITLGGEYLYYMLTDGLVGRVAKGSTSYEALWIDPEYKEGTAASLLYDIRYSDGRLYFTRFALGDDVPNSCDDGEQALTGAVYSIDPSVGVGVEEKALAKGVNFASSLDVSDEYVFFFAQNNALLNRVPKAGGAVESFVPASGELIFSNAATDFSLAVLPPIEVNGDWVYFGASTFDGGKAIARLPVGGPNWGTQAAEIVARPTGPFHFTVDDEALYWIECETNTACENGRLQALVLSPP
ncbi:hypothetical protein [Polyangium sp. 15x6]|uniref:hypothetical protein n=1 Tax=Polyangium sp. 15x6 TaxID=3042687 RepID=UPI00249CEEAF|nr:hypothetical protein [Polyangium sp. 15x6]MDI3284693.1 hypothetical protein [Polyangium sp. 15x6]